MVEIDKQFSFAKKICYTVDAPLYKPIDCWNLSAPFCTVTSWKTISLRIHIWKSVFHFIPTGFQKGFYFVQTGSMRDKLFEKKSLRPVLNACNPFSNTVTHWIILHRNSQCGHWDIQMKEKITRFLFFLFLPYKLVFSIFLHKNGKKFRKHVKENEKH